MGHWGMVAFKAMTRLDGMRSKTRYIVVGREEYNAIIFPVGNEQGLMVAATFELMTNPREIFDALKKLFVDNAAVRA